jgi:hypothetical protein
VEWTQKVSGLGVGLHAIRSLSVQAAELVVEERDRGGPFASLAELRRRVPLSPADLALLVRCALDFIGRGEALLREADLARLGRLPPRWREEAVELGPLAGLLVEDPLGAQWQAEWELLGFSTKARRSIAH